MNTCFNALIAADVEWLKSLPSSSSGPPPMTVHQPIPSDMDDPRHIQQMLLAMHSVPPAGSRWAAPPVGIAGVPRAAAVHPSIQHANHVGVQSVDSAVEHSVSWPLLASSSSYNNTWSWCQSLIIVKGAYILTVMLLPWTIIVRLKSCICLFVWVAYWRFSHYSVISQPCIYIYTLWFKKKRANFGGL